MGIDILIPKAAKEVPKIILYLCKIKYRVILTNVSLIFGNISKPNLNA